MDARKLERFDRAAAFMACPVCGSPLARDGGRLICPAGHSYDIARQGYVNLLAGGHARKREADGRREYDRASFEMRRRVFASGLYDAVARAVEDAVASVDADAAPLGFIDAGCGEGFFSRRVRAVTDAPILSLDISRDSVQLAAGTDPSDRIAWAVADLSALPVLDHSASCVLNVFSPANYREFRRVARDGGAIVKVVPTSRHLEEVRALAEGSLRSKAYSNERVVEHFFEFCRIERRVVAGATSELDDATRDALIAMTPLLFGADVSDVDWSRLTRATVEAEVLVGRL